MVDKYVFKKPTDEYLKSKLNPTQEYIEQASTFISKMKNISIQEAKQEVVKCIKASNTRNPILTFNKRQENGDITLEEQPIILYIKETQENDEVLVPSFTSYMHPRKKKSLHSSFVNINVRARNADKKKLFFYMQKNDKERADYYDNMQASRKIDNNSLSGAYASKGTTFYNPSAHSTLTSITRSLTSIGNALTESMVGGNRIFLTPDSVINYITTILVHYDKELFNKVKVKYSLKEPSVKEVLDAFKESCKWYWHVPSKMEFIKKYLNTLTGTERAIVLYTNDLYHLRVHNEDLVRTLVSELSQIRKGYSQSPLEDIDNAQEGVMNHAHNVCYKEIQGMAVNYKELQGTDTLDMLSSTCHYVAETVTKYKDLITVLFVTNISPINIAYIKDMIRYSIVLSDTDSTCGAYDKWADWYFSKPSKGTETRISVGSSIMTIVTQVMDHYIKILSGNMNIAPENFEKLKMKNEFYWLSFITTNAGKHYFADTFIKEGNVFGKSKPERKGVMLLASKIASRYRDYANEMMSNITTSIIEQKKIDLHDLIKETADLERYIIARIKAADTTVLSKDKIKDSKAYTLTPDKSPYQHHILWEEVFSKKYGSAGDPAYEVIKVPTVLKSAKATNDYLDTIEDKEIATKLKQYLARNKKSTLGTFRPPLWITSNKGLPEEIISCIDYRRIVFDNCLGIYHVLETLGFYKPPKFMISELGPY